MKRNKKITGFENMIIKKALRQHCEIWVQDILSKGESHIFHETFPDLMYDQICNKIDSLTYKNDLK